MVEENNEKGKGVRGRMGCLPFLIYLEMCWKVMFRKSWTFILGIQCLITFVVLNSDFNSIQHKYRSGSEIDKNLGVVDTVHEIIT